MPPINKYKCNFCDFSFPDGWGGYFYVEVDEELIGNRIHELEDQLSNLNRNFTKIKGCMTETERALSEFIKTRSERGISRTHEIVQQLQHLMKELEVSLVWERDSLEQQIRDFRDIESRLKFEGLRSMRVECPHPSESDYAMKILGQTFRNEYESRTGFNSYVVCLDCLHQFEADLRDEKVNEWRFWYGKPSFREAFRGKPAMKDERRCLKCGSKNVKTAFEMIGEKCPKCKKGTIEEIETGIEA